MLVKREKKSLKISPDLRRLKVTEVNVDCGRYDGNIKITL